VIIDPTDDNNAISDDGRPLVAFRLIRGVKDPTAPTVAELNDPDNQFIVGYGEMPDLSAFNDDAGGARG
jgi:hypothetical protein